MAQRTLTGPITNLGNLNLTTGGTKYFAGSFTNAGSLLVTGTGYVGTNASNTSIINQACATIDYQADAPLRVASAGYTGISLVNSGTFKKTAGTAPRPSSSRSAERARSRPTPAPSSSPAEASAGRHDPGQRRHRDLVGHLLRQPQGIGQRSGADQYRDGGIGRSCRSISLAARCNGH